MIPEKIDEEHIVIQAKSIVISCHGITYTITSSFSGIRVSNDHPDGIRVIHDYNISNSVVIK